MRVSEGSQILWIRSGKVLSHTVSLEVVCEGVKIRRSKMLPRVSLEMSCGMCRGKGSQRY